MNLLGSEELRPPAQRYSDPTNRLANLVLFLTPVSLAIACWWFNPFCQVVVSNSAPLSRLSPAQQANIELAAQSVNGFVLAPGETFSFNQTVGARTAERGYIHSPSYLGGDTPMTFGGGICLLSSLLYRDALELGLTVKERNPHTRTIETVPAGLDATVWSGRSDLKFTNTSNVPLRIAARADSSSLKVEFLGDRNSPSRLHKFHLRRAVAPAGPGRIEVTVDRLDSGGRSTLISRDVYCLPARLGPVEEVKPRIDQHSDGRKN